jgi:hypothetical protein
MPVGRRQVGGPCPVGREVAIDIGIGVGIDIDIEPKAWLGRVGFLHWASLMNGLHCRFASAAPVSQASADYGYGAVRHVLQRHAGSVIPGG